MSKNYCNESNPHNVKVGDIFNMSWGYDQTNNNFFQVTRVSPKGVWVREIGAKSVAGTQGFMCETIVPNPNAFLDRSQWCNTRGNSFNGNVETFRRVCMSNWKKDATGKVVPEAYFNFEGRYFAYRCAADSTHYNSWYA